MTSTRPHVAVATITIKAHDAQRLARFWLARDPGTPTPIDNV